MSIEDDRREIVSISNDVLGHWYENKRNHACDGASGNFFENQYGVAENNKQMADYNGIYELKALKDESVTMLTLLTKEPLPRASVPKMVNKYGYHDVDGKQALRISVVNKANERGIFYKLQKQQNKIKILFDPSKISESNAEWKHSIISTYGINPDFDLYYNLDEVIDIISSKLNNVVLAYYEEKNEESKNYVRYNSIFIYEGMNKDYLVDCFKSGKVRIDFRARVGKNHGTAMRLLRKDINNRLWKNVEVIK